MSFPDEIPEFPPDVSQLPCAKCKTDNHEKGDVGSVCTDSNDPDLAFPVVVAGSRTATLQRKISTAALCSCLLFRIVRKHVLHERLPLSNTNRTEVSEILARHSCGLPVSGGANIDRVYTGATPRETRRCHRRCRLSRKMGS